MQILSKYGNFTSTKIHANFTWSNPPCAPIEHAWATSIQDEELKCGPRPWIMCVCVCVLTILKLKSTI